MRKLLLTMIALVCIVLTAAAPMNNTAGNSSLSNMSILNIPVINISEVIDEAVKTSDELDSIKMLPEPGSVFARHDLVQMKAAINTSDAVLAIIQWKNGYSEHELSDLNNDMVFESDFFNTMELGRYNIKYVVGGYEFLSSWFTVGDMAKIKDTFEIQDTVTISYGNKSKIVAASYELPDDIQNEMFTRQMQPHELDAPVPEIRIANLTSAIDELVLENVVINGTLEIGVEDLDINEYEQSFAIDPSRLNFTKGKVNVKAKGTTLYKCKTWDYQAKVCPGEWVLVRNDLIPGQIYSIELTAEDPAFGEKIEVLNIQSYPVVGGNWTVRFITEGTADLQIYGINGTTWNPEKLPEHDLQFLSLKCGSEPVEYEWINNSVYVANYSCNQTSYETSHVITAGIHNLMFRYGGQVAYAKNLADILKMEWGNYTAVNSSWRTVNLVNEYNNPVVIASVNYVVAGVATVTRIKSVTSTSFDLKLQHPGDSVEPTTRDVYYLVVEEGQWTLRDGTAIEAWTYLSKTTDQNNDWTPDNRTYQNSYTNPVVLGQVMTANDPDWSVFWASDGTQTNPPDASDLEMSKHVGEDTDVTRINETIGYMVIEEGHGTIEGIEYDAVLSGDTVRGPENGPPFTESYSAAFSSVPDIAVVSAAAMDGGDGGWPNIYGAAPFALGTIDLMYDEDTIADADRAHATEQVAIFTFETAGSFVYNDPPDVLNPYLNTTNVELNAYVLLNVTVEDIQGNDTVASVNATFRYPNTTIINVSLYQVFQQDFNSVTDVESGEQEIDAETDICSPACPTNVQAENNIITMSTLETSVTVDLKNSYVLNRTYMKIHHASGHTANSMPDEASVSGRFLNESAIVFERYSTRSHTAYMSYSIIQADNILVQNFTYPWSSSEESTDITLSPALSTDFATKCFVETPRNMSLNATTEDDHTEY